ncbi:Helix-turn-helix domain-containing protein, partial [Dysosmobacter welbionis]
EHGDVGGQNGHRRQGILKVGQDHPREGGGQHQHHQPGGPGPPGLKHAGLEIRLVARQDGGHLLDILGDLFLQDVHGVVHGDDAHQAVLRVHNGQGQEVVFVQGLGHILLVVQGVGGDHMGIHDVPHHVVLLRQQNGADGEIPQQVAALVNDVADVDGLLVRAGAADALQGVLHGHGG